MDDAFGVGCFQGVGRLDGKFQEFVRGYGGCTNSLLQSLPFEQLHDDHRLAIVFLHFINGADIGVV